VGGASTGGAGAVAAAELCWQRVGDSFIQQTVFIQHFPKEDSFAIISFFTDF